MYHRISDIPSEKHDFLFSDADPGHIPYDRPQPVHFQLQIIRYIFFAFRDSKPADI